MLCFIIRLIFKRCFVIITSIFFSNPSKYTEYLEITANWIKQLLVCIKDLPKYPYFYLWVKENIYIKYKKFWSCKIYLCESSYSCVFDKKIKQSMWWINTVFVVYVSNIIICHGPADRDNSVQMLQANKSQFILRTLNVLIPTGPQTSQKLPFHQHHLTPDELVL